jgi:hypothetical protein
MRSSEQDAMLASSSPNKTFAESTKPGLNPRQRMKSSPPGTPEVGSTEIITG